MFTGIIERVGRIATREVGRTGGRLIVEADDVQARVGDSIAVEGVCLTATGTALGRLTFDLSLETLTRTTLGDLPLGRDVNLETSLRLGDALGGHIVQGHVDGRGSVASIEGEGEGFRLSIDMPPFLLPHLALKGSVAVNGVSLTIASRTETRVGIALIPHTYRHTTLRLLQGGDPVNVEVDVISRYLENLLAHRSDKEAQPHVSVR